MTKEQIEKFPPYDGKALTSQEKWADYEKRCRSKWVEKPVMHREHADRNVTPTTKQPVHSGSGSIPATSGTGIRSSAGTGSPDARMVWPGRSGIPADATASEREDETEITAVHPEAEVDTSPNNPAYRWRTFEDTLRRRREEVLEESVGNATRASGERRPGRERRKAS